VIATRTLEGGKVQLVPERLEHAELLARWNADPEVRHWLHRSEDPPELLTRDALAGKIRELWADPSEIRFIIEADDGRPIGGIGLLGIHRAGRAEVSIAIGEKPYWSRGYGADAVRTLLRFGFGELDLRRITLIADADNARGIACYLRCGFRHEGVLRAWHRHGDVHHDVNVFGLLRADWPGAPFEVAVEGEPPAPWLVRPGAAPS
jgi:RimJ/RimL family protein N-acetyltransferase